MQQRMLGQQPAAGWKQGIAFSVGERAIQLRDDWPFAWHAQRRCLKREAEGEKFQICS